MHFKYGYGRTYKEFDINDENILMELRQNHVDIKLTGADEVKRALDNPIGTDRLSKIIKPGEKVAIITSDITRPMPSKIVLPLILEELREAGVKYEDITVVFALGSHRKHTEEEKKYLVGEDVYNKVQCVDSDPSDFVHMGVTSRGTPVDIFSAVAKADRRICLGNIEFHYFAGYSGGAKAIMPGVSTRAAIQANHSAMVKNEARAGAMDDNPVRLDIEEVVQFVPIDFILNVVLDEKKNIIKAVAGHHVHAHREGCKFLDSLYKVEIPQKADIVITTPGGYPKDINLYQAQKALDNSKHAVRDGGIVILLASCTEGLGEEVFERWLLNADSPDSMISDIQKNFELGGHKAAAIALVQKKAKIYLVSDLEKDFVRKLFMEPFDDISEALESAFNELGQDAKVLLMPYGGSTLPYVKA
ncbi:transcriptional regulator [Clostridium thermosuccinogenes]|uniref:Transcriptional regulator n=1 Tax=Clostridium thermosuccinogenes TaxID=84032 RepID=A0A2K2FGT5_9CLOT|nr:nickel-dependent lactate racemase [Pseudoclostridium thermosuccinogenes]AUS96538.1 transcriptional regulator [Pseudoclostridium thermosuccinogenes]PNT97974.1 transcriptional regulator [Pseudoclostridium thermosuccinogenes]PNT99993.1 transcriptional regulator [Pseudoclostridium thermosuccinogenes]